MKSIFAISFLFVATLISCAQKNSSEKSKKNSRQQDRLERQNRYRTFGPDASGAQAISELAY
jgi:hypothetical protein